ncbi:TetR/AcrR family transcriptional regulator [Pararhizobium sp. YC-54]|uniref:TetR/AcrR family transcriptional regulator n=1 Tax=Pararhizobium sp. YC-54 TaxID=2986920 RepID=UPI0021F6DBD6|nr:TetR/AcrR family transcriptional regulator [Pararhizobium sp. YC-54]MCV9999658.1 TetR/AcrR family transcriptional regulator [Pararhizobium sp. YC-54]
MTQLQEPRIRILKAAARLFVENGLQSSMALIAETASVSTGSVYNHFPSKEGLILEVCRQLASTMEDVLVRPIDRTIPYRKRVDAYVGTYIDFIWADADRAALYDYISNTPAIPIEELLAIFDRVTEHSIAIFSEAQEGGPGWGLSPKLAGSFVRGAIRNTLKRHRAAGEDLTEAHRAGIMRMCWNALAS